MLRKISPFANRSERYLLAAAAALHLCLAVCLYMAGRLALLPEIIDRDGIIKAFADCYLYQKEAALLVDKLSAEGLWAWLIAPAWLHVKLASILFALFSTGLGFSVLSIEPLNLLYYLLILIFIYKLGENTFDRQSGIIAAGVVALWPSFLVHTLQFLKDSLFIAATLALLLVVSNWLTKTYEWRRGLVTGLAGGALIATLGLVRPEFKVMVLVIISLAVMLLVARQWLAKRLLPGNLLSAVLVLLLFLPSTYLGVARFISIKQAAPTLSSATAGGEEEAAANEVKDKTTTSAPVPKQQMNFWMSLRSAADHAASRVGTIRRNFVVGYPDSNSTLDGNVVFKDAGDVLRYLPRACLIGFFAPFPDMWLARSARVGATGKLISATETLFMYAVQVLAVIGLFHERRSFSAWLLFLTASIGVTTLGLVVANVGALYRQRYVFWFLFIILGVRGAIHLSRHFLFRARTQATSETALAHLRVKSDGIVKGKAVR